MRCRTLLLAFFAEVIGDGIACRAQREPIDQLGQRPLAEVAHRGAVVDERKVELTSVVPLYPPQRSSINLIQRQNIQCLRTADIDLARLVLPSDFNEASWPGFQNEPGLPRLTERAVARWRAIPRGE